MCFNSILLEKSYLRLLIVLGNPSYTVVAWLTKANVVKSQVKSSQLAKLLSLRERPLFGCRNESSDEKLLEAEN